MAPKKSLLIVDDNEDAANTLAVLLDLKGFNTQVAYTGGDALALVKANPVDAVLLDIGLPDQTGTMVAQLINRELDMPPLLIAVTGYGQEVDRIACLQAGFAAHLVKPVAIETLMKTLDELLNA